jgi:hypothetical protein
LPIDTEIAYFTLLGGNRHIKKDDIKINLQMNIDRYGRRPAGIFKPVWSPGIDAKASTPPAYVAWRAGTITLFLVGA